MQSAHNHIRSATIIRHSVLVGFLLLNAVGLSERASAQPPASTERSDASEEVKADSVAGTITAPPGATLAPASDPYDTYVVRRAEDQVKRARNGLIATSAAFGVGWIFIGVAASQCDRVNDEFVCNNAGKALGTIGMISTGGGLVGMIVSGILLPVRQKKERDLRRSIHQRTPARLRWDVESGKVVF